MCLKMLKHLLATFVSRVDVAKFGHHVGQQFNSYLHALIVDITAISSGSKILQAPSIKPEGSIYED